MNRFFRNVRMYRIHSQWPGSEEALSEVLENAAFKPCGAFSERSGGFEPPVTGAGDLLSQACIRGRLAAATHPDPCAAASCSAGSLGGSH